MAITSEHDTYMDHNQNYSSTMSKQSPSHMYLGTPNLSWAALVKTIAHIYDRATRTSMPNFSQWSYCIGHEWETNDIMAPAVNICAVCWISTFYRTIIQQLNADAIPKSDVLRIMLKSKWGQRLITPVMNSTTTHTSESQPFGARSRNRGLMSFPQRENLMGGRCERLLLDEDGQFID